MHSINIGQEKYQMAESWAEVPLRQFLAISEIKEENKTVNSVKILSILLGCPEDLLYKLDINSFTELIGYIEFIGGEIPEQVDKTFELGGKQYTIREDFSSITVAEIIDIEIVQEQCAANNPRSFAKVISILVKEEGQAGYDRTKALSIEQIVLDQMNTQQALGIVSFFLHSMQRSQSDTRDSGQPVI
jgi:hypothetical protein